MRVLAPAPINDASLRQIDQLLEKESTLVDKLPTGQTVDEYDSCLLAFYNLLEKRLLEKMQKSGQEIEEQLLTSRLRRKLT